MDNLQENTVHTFSFEMQDFDEPMSDRQMLLQIRHYSALLLNQVAEGTNRLTEKNKESIRFYNDHCHIVGLKPLELPL